MEREVGGGTRDGGKKKVAKKLTFINTVALEKVNLSSSLYLKNIFLILPIAIFQCLSSVLLLSYFIKL